MRYEDEWGKQTGQMVLLLLMGLPQFWAISVAVRLPQPAVVK